jgi:hypothetical protein
VLRRIFGPMREKVAGSWRRQYNKVFCNSYMPSNILRMIK